MSEMVKTVYLVMSESGEYEQRQETILGAYETRELAETALARRRGNAIAYQSAWDAWCKSGGSRGPNPMPECLTPGECCGDRWAILEVPIGVSGNYDPEYGQDSPFAT